MQIEYKDLKCGCNQRTVDENNKVVVFIHAEYDDKLDFIYALQNLITMVVNDEL